MEKAQKKEEIFIVNAGSGEIEAKIVKDYGDILMKDDGSRYEHLDVEK